jgi:hypothetical protein
MRLTSTFGIEKKMKKKNRSQFPLFDVHGTNQHLVFETLNYNWASRKHSFLKVSTAVLFFFNYNWAHANTHAPKSPVQ